MLWRKRFSWIKKHKFLITALVLAVVFLVPIFISNFAKAENNSSQSGSSGTWKNASTIIYAGREFVDDKWDDEFLYGYSGNADDPLGSSIISDGTPDDDIPDIDISLPSNDEIKRLQTYLENSPTKADLNGVQTINLDSTDNAAIWFYYETDGDTHSDLVSVWKEGKSTEKGILSAGRYVYSSEESSTDVGEVYVAKESVNCNGESPSITHLPDGRWEWSIVYPGGLLRSCWTGLLTTNAQLVAFRNQADLPPVTDEPPKTIFQNLPGKGEWVDASEISYDWDNDGNPDRFINPVLGDNNPRYYLEGDKNACSILVSGLNIDDPTSNRFKQAVIDSGSTNLSPKFYAVEGAVVTGCLGNSKGNNFELSKDIILDNQQNVKNWFLVGSNSQEIVSVWRDADGGAKAVIGTYTLQSNNLFERESEGSCRPQAVDTSKGNRQADWDIYIGNNCTPKTGIPVLVYSSLTGKAEETKANQIANSASTEQTAANIGCSVQSGSLGWILCPLINGSLQLVDFMAGLISHFLVVPPLQLNDTNGPIYQVWSTFRNISLSLLVVSMLIMVFGQALSLNIDAYMVKKMLPRIIIGAIGIMLSLYVAAFLIDFFNVLGKGVADLVEAAFTANGANGGGDIFVSGFGSFTGTLLAQITGGVILFNMGIASFMLGILIPVVLAFITVYLTLILRQTVIVLLVILAPIAFVAWTVPGLEKYFKSWFSMLIKALMMFPLIMLLIASGKVFAVIVTNVPNGQAGWLNMITALVALALPMFIIPSTFKLSGGLIGAASNALNNMRATTRQRLRDPNDRLGRNLKKYQALHDVKKDVNRAKYAQGYDRREGQKIRNIGRGIRRGLVAGSLLASGAGRGILRKDALAAAGVTAEEMKALGLKSPYSFKDYLKHGMNKGSLNDRIRKLRAQGNTAQAEDLKTLGATFGAGNQAIASVMLSTLGSMGKLEDKDIINTGRFFGGQVGTTPEITRDENGNVVNTGTMLPTVSFGPGQRAASSMFSQAVTDAGFNAAGADLGQWEFKNGGLRLASDGSGNRVYDRHANKINAEDGRKPFNTSDADWELANKIPMKGRVDPKSIEHLAPSIRSHVNSAYGASQTSDFSDVSPEARNWITNLASIVAFGNAPAEVQAAYEKHVVSQLNDKARSAYEEAKRRGVVDPRNPNSPISGGGAPGGAGGAGGAGGGGAGGAGGGGT